MQDRIVDCLLVRPQRQADEVFVLHDGLAAHLAVPRLEAVRQPLHVDADHDEVVEGEQPRLGVVLGQDVLDEGGGEPVAHLLEGLGQLRVFNESAPVTTNRAFH